MKGSISVLRATALVLVLAALPVTAADRLDQLVSADEAKAMGLDKLDPAERATLAAWLERRLEAGPVPLAAPSATAATKLERTEPAAAALGTVEAFGLEERVVDGDVKEFTAKIVGPFTGWDGKTLFKLDNGQVWRQSVSGSYHYKATDPAVVIEKAFLGYKLRLVDTKRSIAVRRVR